METIHDFYKHLECPDNTFELITIEEVIKINLLLSELIYETENFNLKNLYSLWQKEYIQIYFKADVKIYLDR